jgi:MauM/NapG family ferredoxin protein
MAAGEDDKKRLSRRDLFTFWRREPAAPPLPPPLRPPGMMQELMLQNTCTRCGKCVEVCPADAIVPLPASRGPRLAGTPAIDARRQPCVLCTGLRCTHVCPSGALIPVFVNNDVAMGTAVLDAGRCLPYRGQACDKCAAICPIPGAIVTDDSGRVRIDDGRCVGCGLCEQVCPTEPSSVRVVPRD